MHDKASGEDIVHQVFVKLLRGNTTVPKTPIGYLYRAVRNSALNKRRDRSGEGPYDETIPWFQHKGGNLEATLTLQATLRELPEEQREVLIMRIWSGLTLEVVATATGVSPSTAASRYRYALGKLRDRMRPWQRAEE